MGALCVSKMAAAPRIGRRGKVTAVSEVRPRRRISRDEIRSAAVSRFEALGYHGTSMRDIAAEAGVNVASIYNHYESKQGLLREIMVDLMTEVLANTRAGLAAAGTAPSARLCSLVRIWVMFHTCNRAEAVISASEMRSLADEARREVVGLRDEQERIFREVVHDGVKAGEFATPYPTEAARAIISMGVTVASWYRRDGSRFPEEIADRYAQLALGAVRGPFTDRMGGP